MAEFPISSPSPARVHDRARQLIGHHPCWIRRPYSGGLFSIEHFRICSYCGSANPNDLIDLMHEGRAMLEDGSRPGKYLMLCANPIAGELVRMGSSPGPIFDRAKPPADLRQRLRQPAREDLNFSPSIGERLAGHFERPMLEPAPALIRWPLYSEHVHERQWPEIWAAKGENAS